MYLYDDLDRTLVTERAAEFRDQVARRLSGELTEDEFKPLRLMNGIYLQLHAYMLQIDAIHQTERLELILGQLTRQPACHLITKLSGTLGDERAIEIIVEIHCLDHS